MPHSFHLIPEVRKLTRAHILYVHMLYMVFIFIRVGFSVEINQRKFRGALIYGKRILGDRGSRIKHGIEETGVLINLWFSPHMQKKVMWKQFRRKHFFKSRGWRLSILLTTNSLRVLSAPTVLFTVTLSI